MKRAAKFLGILTCVFLIYCFIVGITMASPASYLEYIFDEESKTATIIGINSKEKYVTIPQEIEGYKVTSIDDDAFKDNNDIVTIELPNTISYIGAGAFQNCSNLLVIYGLEYCFELKTIENNTFDNCRRLRWITLPSNLDTIGDYAFKSCHKLQKMLLPESVVSIGKHAFDNCQSIKEIKIPRGVDRIEKGTFLGCISMKSIVLPEGITHIGYAAFNICRSLESILIPSTVNVIEEGAFLECYSLSSIDVAPDNPTYTSIDGVLYDMDITELIAYPSGKTDKTYSIPQGVTKISKAVFAYNQHLDRLNVPKSLNLIENFFLYDASVKTINYDGSVADWKEIDTIGGLDFGELFGAINCSDGKISAYGEVTYN